MKLRFVDANMANELLLVGACGIVVFLGLSGVAAMDLKKRGGKFGWLLIAEILIVTIVVVVTLQLLLESR